MPVCPDSEMKFDISPIESSVRWAGVVEQCQVTEVADFEGIRVRGRRATESTDYCPSLLTRVTSIAAKVTTAFE